MAFRDWKHLPEGCGKHEASRAHAVELWKVDGFKQSPARTEKYYEPAEQRCQRQVLH